MNYPAFEVFGSQHLISLLICFTAIIGIPKYFQAQTEVRKALGAKLVAGTMILHMLTQPVYDIFLFILFFMRNFFVTLRPFVNSSINFSKRRHCL